VGGNRPWVESALELMLRVTAEHLVPRVSEPLESLMNFISRLLPESRNTPSWRALGFVAFTEPATEGHGLVAVLES
jgi:hypothetical protein